MAGVTGLILLNSGIATAQESEEPVPTPVPTPQPTAIPAAEIPGRAAAIGPLLRSVESRVDFSSQLTTIEEGFKTEKSYVAELEDETLRRLEIEGPASVVEESGKVWIRTSARLDGWLLNLSKGAAAIDNELEDLMKEGKLWELTHTSADEVELPAAVLEQVESTLAAIEATRRRMQSDRDAILTLQSEISNEKALADEMSALLREEFASRRRGLLGLDSPPLWAAFGVPGVDGSPSDQMVAVWNNNFRSVRQYTQEERPRIFRQTLFLILLTAGFVFFRNRAQLWVQQDRSLQPAARILDRPFAAALIITVLLGSLFHPRAPSSWLDFLGLILLFALLRLLPRMLAPQFRLAAYLLAVLFFLELLVLFAPDGNLINRLALLVLSSAAAATCVWLIRTIEDPNVALSRGWESTVKLFCRVAFLVFVVGCLANIVGSVGFATYLVLSTLDSAFLAVLFWVAAVLLRTIVRVVLLTETARGFGLVRLHAETVRNTIFRLINVFAVVGWVAIVVYEFGALGSAFARIVDLLGRQFSIGDFTIAPADVLVFLLVFWISFKISRLVRFVLDTDIMPRMDLPRGVPGAIDRLSHYAIIVVGFMIAVAAAGLDFSRVTLIVGALGVGIGFGLQNVVNNFVSGLILLFERPIRVGDKLQVGELFGVVKDIGMRASVVRTYQGAEVVVPNADLISSEVVNWTLSDDRRRIEIVVGVAYGTAPATVIDLLVGVAEAHLDVLEDPPPKTLFIDFGASSLDFELRAWTRGDFVGVSSDLRVGIIRALADAGIEIPFPQRDLHIRTNADGHSGVVVGPEIGSQSTEKGTSGVLDNRKPDSG